MRTTTPGLLLVLAGIAAADPTAAGPEPDAALLERGRSLYRTHCLNCHGPTGEGNGPMADLLVVRPADLTRLTADNGGSFPSDRVYRAIDGREEVRAHGRQAMPIWGLSFQQLDRDTDQEEEVRARILALVAHLESLQRPAPPAD